MGVFPCGLNLSVMNIGSGSRIITRGVALGFLLGAGVLCWMDGFEGLLENTRAEYEGTV